MNRHNSNNGFIALISILIISAVLLATTLSLAQFGIANRYFILDLELKTVSKKLAEGCVEMARIQTYTDPSYTVLSTSPTLVPLAGKTCTIRLVSRSGNNATIETVGISGSAVTNLRVTLDTRTGNYLSWTELPSF